jgi:hypothetical protein
MEIRISEYSLINMIADMIMMSVMSIITVTIMSKMSVMMFIRNSKIVF